MTPAKNKTTSWRDVRRERLERDSGVSEESIAKHKRIADLEVELHAIREELGLTQQDVADAMGTSRPRISAIEKGGEDLRLSTLKRYAEALGGQLTVQMVFPAPTTDGSSGAPLNSPRADHTTTLVGCSWMPVDEDGSAGLCGHPAHASGLSFATLLGHRTK